MRPKQPETEPQEDLFRARLANLVDRRHALVRLAGLIDWGRFETEFGPLYTDGIGRPGLPTRLMAGLHLPKRMDGLSDEAACARYLDSPYAQLFCGEAYFQHASPLDRSSMTRWRRRIGAERLEVLLAEGLATAERGGAVEEKHFRRVTIDTTVQPKAVTHPTDSKLLHRGIEILARLARRHGVRLRQAFLRVAKRAKREVARLMHSGRARQAERRVRQLRTWLGRLRRDIGRKIAGDAAAEAAFAGPLALIARLLHQRREDRGGDKLYSLHAPEVECIGKGKAHARFEFGVKVSIATTNAVAPGGQFVLGARALPGNPYDGHTLADQIAQAERITGTAVERLRRPRLPRPRRRQGPRVHLRPEAGRHAPHPPRAAPPQRHRARHRAHEGRWPPRTELPARRGGRRRQRRPRRSRPQPPPAPGLAGLALCVPARPTRGRAPDRDRPPAETCGRLKPRSSRPTRYNAEWLIEKNGLRSPNDARAAWNRATIRHAA